VSRSSGRIALAGAFLLLVLAGVAAHGDAAAGTPHYSMSVSIDYDAGTYVGELLVVAANNTGAPLNELFFRLYPNATAVYGDAALRVIETRIGDRVVDTAMYVDDTVLYVPLPEPLAAGDTVAVSLAFEGCADDWTSGSFPAAGTYGLLARSDRAMTLTAFYPILAFYTAEGWSIDPVFSFGDALMSDAASYDVRVTVPLDLTPAASGTQDEAIVEADGAATYRFTIEGARDFSLVVVDGYEEQRQLVDGVSLRSWFTPSKAHASSVALRHAADALSLYGTLIGPVRYREIDLVEVPLQVAAGVEFSGLILVSSDYAERPLDTFYQIIVSHEMAHQWFYAGVGSDPTEEPWLDESFATYLSYLYLDAFAGAGVASSTFRQWENAYEQARLAEPDTTIDSPLYAFQRSTNYSALVYSGGAVLLHAIRETIGDEAFFTALSSYYTAHLGAIVTPPDLIAAFETACTCNLADLLEAYDVGP
jgi:hypothetical protein